MVKVKDDRPECPLCYKPMRQVTQQGIKYWVCLREFCMISIRADDPICGRWREKEERVNPTCPICKERMRLFFRAADNYMKMQCHNPQHKGIVQIARGDASYLPPLEDTH